MNAQDLKNSILQLAIQGKLVEQRKEEGTAKELLEQIKVEKEQLVKEKKLKQKVTFPDITEDEIPFEIPESWEWVRLGDLISIESGKGLTSNNMKEGTIPVYGGNGITGYHNEGLVEEETVVIGRVGFYCGSVHITEKKAWVTDNAFLTTYPQKSIDRNYLVYILRHMNLGKNNNATAQPVVSGKKIYPLLFPLPPLEEQKRIVAKVEELMPYVEKYGEAHSKLEVFNKKFPEDMKKSILQYAIQGKLVEQRDEEGTAEELCQRIQEEKVKLIKEGKIKKKKPLPAIAEHEIPFHIPDSWKWVRLGNVIDLLSGQDFPPEKYNDSNKGIPYITGASSLSDNGVIVNRWTEEPRCIANAGDVLLVCKGSGYGKTVVCDIEEGHIARQIMSIKYTTYIDMVYLKYFLGANYSLIKKWGQGVIPGIDRKSIQNMLFPLPPLQEQKRIVSKIEEVIPYCQQLIK